MSAPYHAVLSKLDQSETYANEVTAALTDDEAKAKAYQWAWTECGKRGIAKALLILTGGTIKRSHSEVIDLS